MTEKSKTDISKAVETVMRKRGVTIPDRIKEYTVEEEDDKTVEKS